ATGRIPTATTTAITAARAAATALRRSRLISSRTSNRATIAACSAAGRASRPRSRHSPSVGSIRTISCTTGSTETAVSMHLRSVLFGSIAAGTIVATALAQPFRIVEVASVANLPVSQIAPQTIAFSDHKGDNVTDRTSGLIKFEDWAQTRPVQKQFLGLYPTFEEPVLGLGTSAKPHKKRLHVYVAEGRFALKRAPA